METTVLDDIPLKLAPRELISELHARDGSRPARDIARLASEAASLARPRALYRPSPIREHREDGVVVEEAAFTSRVLAVNVARLHRVFPFVATCGEELEVWSRSLGREAERFWAEHIKGKALGAAVLALFEHIGARFDPGGLSMMNPGSIEDWPLGEQPILFGLLGDPERTVGVRLLETFLMSPGMSASGILFAGEERFENCMLCTMQDCPGRRAPHDPHLYERRYRRGKVAGGGHG